MAFGIPLHFEDLSRPTAGPWRVSVQNPRGLLPVATAGATTLLEPSDEPTEPFTALYSLVSRYASLDKSARVALVELVTGDVAEARSDTHAVKVATFFLAGLASCAEAVVPVCKFWDKTGREAVMEAALRIATGVPAPCPFSAADTDEFAGLLVRMVLGVLESPVAARDKNTRKVLAHLLASALSLDPNQALAASTALLHALNRHEHVAAPLANLLLTLVTEHPQHVPFVTQFLREIARLPVDHLARDAAAAKSCATFLADLADRLPDVVRANLPALLTHLDGDSYSMRNGVVHAIGALVRHSPTPDDPLLDILMERGMRDVHAFTRSKTLQTWATLANHRVIPNLVFGPLADTASSRLDDKTAAVRKSAAQLLVALLHNNPFGPALRKTHFAAKLKEAEAAVDNSSGDASSEVGTEVVASDEADKENADGNTNSAGEPELSVLRDAEQEKGAEMEMGDEATGETVVSQEELKRRFYASAVSFISSVEDGLEKVYAMLRSKSITDVSESVALLVTAVQFQLEAASGRAVRVMLSLILAREVNIRTAAVNAYTQLLAPGGVEMADDKDAAMTVANGLIALGVGATIGELACLEELVAAMSTSDSSTGCVISPAVIAVMWDIFAGKVPGASMEQRSAACILVGMFAAARPESLQQRVKILESVGLSEALFARWSCVALCKLPCGSDSDRHLSNRLLRLADQSEDLGTVEQAINAVYRLHPAPEADVAALVRGLAAGLHASGENVPVAHLARFLLVVGHVSIKQLVRIESLVGTIRQSASRASSKGGGNDNDEEEHAVAEADKALELAERELVAPNSLLGRYGETARRIAADSMAPTELRASGVLCMTKLMCVQSEYCERNLQLLFTILETAESPFVRSNAVTALGDLAFRFPNLVEPWSPRIYASLQDSHVQVRKNTLMALTHLILNDMVKVKGQIVGLALCMLDTEPRIADLARLFFHELARKSSNAVYNILPDTISCMSRKDSVTAEDFKTVVGFLIGLMDKDKHADGMVDKLCHRFRTSESDRENRDLAFCISLLNMSERGLKKLNDAFKSYASALADDNVHSLLSAAVSKSSKNCSTNGNAALVVEEITAKFLEQRRAQDEEEQQATTSKNASVTGEDMDEDEDGDEDEGTEVGEDEGTEVGEDEDVEEGEDSEDSEDATADKEDGKESEGSSVYGDAGSGALNPAPTDEHLSVET